MEGDWPAGAKDGRFPSLLGYNHCAKVRARARVRVRVRMSGGKGEGEGGIG